MKKFLAMLTALVLIAALGTTALAETEVTIWTPDIVGGDYLTALRELADRFETENEGVTITIEELNFDGIGEKLESAMMTGTTPDIYIDGTARTAKLPSTGLTADVSDVIGALDGWNEGAVQIGEVDGAYYLVPITLMPSTILTVNVSLAKQYGVYDLLPEDRVSWDWPQFMAFLEACGEKSLADGVYPIALYAGSQSSDIAYYTMLLSAGAEILNADHTAAAVNTPAAVQAMAYLKEMQDKGLVYPGVAEMKDQDVSGLFLNGKVIVDLTCNGGLSALPAFQQAVNEGVLTEVPEIQGYAWPTLDGSASKCATWGANCAAIFENDGDAEKIEAAKGFLKAMVSDETFNEALWSANLNYGPARETGVQLTIEDEQITRELEMKSVFAQYNDSAFGILESYWGEIRQYFYPEMQSMILGSKTPEEAIQGFEAGVNDVLSHN